MIHQIKKIATSFKKSRVTNLQIQAYIVKLSLIFIVYRRLIKTDKQENMPKEDKQEYEVQRIIDRRRTQGKIQYKVHWKGYYEHQATWQPEDCLQHSKKLIRRYQKTQKIKRQKLLNKKIMIEKQKENLSENQFKIVHFDQLTKLLENKPIYHNPVPYVGLNQLQEPVTTFQSLINKPLNQLVKVQRYDYINGFWREQLQTNAQIIVKTASRQKNELSLSQQPIIINGISCFNKVYFVHFEKGRKYQCELNMLKLIRPNEVIEYLLERYDPGEKKAKVSREIKKYLRDHPQQFNQWSD